MGKKRLGPEKIIPKLREVEVMVNEGRSLEANSYPYLGNREEY